MKIMFRGLASVVAVAMVVLVISLLLPSYYRLATSTRIDAPVNTVYDNLADFQMWRRWEEPGQANVTTSDPSQGVGAWRGWKDSVNGSVMAMITYQESGHALFYRLRFEDPKIVAIGSFQLQPEGEGTHVTWTVSDKLGINPIKRWLGLFLALHAGQDLDRALRNLKAVCETRTGLSRQESAGMLAMAANDSH